MMQSDRLQIAIAYQECLRSTFLDPESWGIALVGLGLALVLWKLGWKYSAIALALSAIVLGVFWAYGYYEFACVELYQ